MDHKSWYDGSLVIAFAVVGNVYLRINQ